MSNRNDSPLDDAPHRGRVLPAVSLILGLSAPLVWVFTNVMYGLMVLFAATVVYHVELELRQRWLDGYGEALEMMQEEIRDLEEGERR